MAGVGGAVQRRDDDRAPERHADRRADSLGAFDVALYYYSVEQRLSSRTVTNYSLPIQFRFFVCFVVVLLWT
jgi:hypothetical protein